jgi:anaerobic dimethyl sulfoxide reductase subunit A
MHPADAARRGIDPGGGARLFNERGVVHVRVRVSDDIMPGVVSLHEGIWFELDARGEDRAGSANMLTGTSGTGPESSCIMHAIAVEVARS